MNNYRHRIKKNYLSWLIAASLLLSGCDTVEYNIISEKYYDGQSDGLIAGLGLSGMKGSAPGYVDANNPTLAELRKNTIYNNFVALIDTSDTGGFGDLYGLKDDHKYSGHEYIALLGEGINLAAVVVQVPDSFNSESPCILSLASSGSRGAYGAIASADWGFDKGCAVVHTDANKGTGAVALTENKGYTGQGKLIAIENGSPVDTPNDTTLSFVVPSLENSNYESNEAYNSIIPPTQSTIDTFVAENPNRFAFKHAHSQKNIEKDWGKASLDSLYVAFSILNDNHSPWLSNPLTYHYDRENTLVIAASISNGGSTVVRAAELDKLGLIDGIVVAEPNISPRAAAQPIEILTGSRPPVHFTGQAMVNFFVEAELYGACAGLAPANEGALFNELRGPVNDRCKGLVAQQLLLPGTDAELGEQARQKLRDFGQISEADKIVSGYGGLDLFQSLVATYVNSNSRSSVVDNLCRVSFAAVNADFRPAASPYLSTLWADSSGIPRTADKSNIVESGVQTIKDDSQGGAMIQHIGVSSNGLQDYNLEGALCWYDIVNNADNPLNARMLEGIYEVQAKGHLHNKPALIVHGRNDGLIHVNYSSRAYYGLVQSNSLGANHARYYEITNAQHLDSLIPSYASVGQLYVPLEYYYKQSLDLMYNHLTEGDALPPSQVVETFPAAAGEALEKANVPDIQVNPTKKIEFDFALNQLQIPE